MFKIAVIIYAKTYLLSLFCDKNVIYDQNIFLIIYYTSNFNFDFDSMYYNIIKSQCFF